MESISKNLLSILVTAINEKDNKVILIKDTKNLSLGDINKTLINLGKKCFYRVLEKHNNGELEPYFPFLTFIDEEINIANIEVEKFLEDINIYPLHKSLFLSYLKCGKAERDEELIFFDYEYEKNKIYESLMNIINKFGDNVFILLENINYMSLSTLNWLKYIVMNNEEYNFKIILTFSDDKYFDCDYQDEFENLIDSIEAKHSLLRLSIKEKSNGDNKKPKKVEKDLIIHGENLYNLFAIDEALICFCRKYKSMIDSNDIYELKQVLLRLGDIYLIKKDYGNSYKYYDLLLNFAIDVNDKRLKTLALQKLSMLNIVRLKFNEAETLAKNSYKLAVEINNDYFKLKSYELLFWINEKGKYRTTIEELNFDEEFIKLARKYNQKNILAYFLTHNFNLISFVGPKDQREDYYMEGLELAEKLKNINCILSADLKTALVYAVNGDHDISQEYYKKVEKILIDMHDNFRLAQTYNGMGYYCLIEGDYIKANDYYNKSLSYLRLEWNFDEICMALINKSLTSLFVCDYETANKQLEILLNVIKTLKLGRLRLTTVSRIYGIAALNHFYLGNLYKSYSFLSKIQTVDISNRFYEDDEEYFLKNFTEALLAKKPGDLDEALKLFRKSYKNLIKAKGSLKCMYPKFMYEYFRILEISEENNNADSVRKEAIKYCKEHNINYYINLIDGVTVNNNYTFESDLKDLSWIIEAAKQEATINSLNDKVEEIHFINSFQEILTSIDDKNTIINNSMTLIENKFSIDYSLLIFYEGETTEILYTTDREILSDNYIKELNAIITEYTSPFVTSDDIDLSNWIERTINEKVRSLIYVPIIKDENLKLIFICATKFGNDPIRNNIILDSSNLGIINISIKEFNETLQKIKWQEKLMESALKDALTGLNNRCYFFDKLSTLVKNNGKKNINACLLYIDLDNFKYYNDTFGHSIGDYILSFFANSLSSICEELKSVDVIRYGGDEFIVLLEQAEFGDGEVLAEKLYEEIKRCRGYEDNIKALLNKNINIPKEKLLSCSMGISYRKLNSSTNYNKLIEEADKCLYKAKNSGKGRYIVFK